MSAVGWQTEAACANTPFDWWFPGKGPANPTAIKTCRSCPVQQECLEDALTTGEVTAIRGGLTPEALSKLHAQRLSEDRACLHCGRPLPRNSHGQRRLHPDCAYPWQIRRKREARLQKPLECAQCGGPRDPGKRFCTDCRATRAKEYPRRTLPTQNTARSPRKTTA